VGLNDPCSNDERRRMVGDLRANHLHKGMTRGDVLALLGKPTQTDVTWIGQAPHDQSALLWSWDIGPAGSGCDSFDVYFIRGRLYFRSGRLYVIGG
jgi:hypothetical protein